MVSAAAVLAMCLTSGVTPAFLGQRDRVGERGELGGDGRVPGDVGAGEMGPQARHLDRAAGLGGQGGLHHGRPVRRGGAAPAQPGVGLELQPGPDAGRLGGRLDPGHERDRARCDVHVAADRLGRIAERHQAQHRRRDARPAQRDRLVQVRHAQPALPAQRRPGGPDHAVAVPVGLHRGQHLAAADQLAQRGHVTGDRAEVDDSFPVGHGHTLRNAPGRTRTRLEAPSGPRLALARARRRPAWPARPCR